MVWRQKLNGLAALFLVGVLLITPAIVIAHSALVSSNPSNGAELDTPPERIELTFNENVQAGHIVLRNESGSDVLDAPLTLDPAQPEMAFVELKALDAGSYDAEWSVLSRDGHPVQGKLTFTILAADVRENEAPDASGGEAVNAEPTTEQTQTGSDAPATDSNTNVGQEAVDAAEQTNSSGIPWLWIGLGAVAIVGLGALLRKRS